MVELLLLAVALAVDATVVNAQIGATPGRTRMAMAAVVFGLFQGGMAAIGAAGGVWVVERMAGWEGWIAFGLLTAVGLRMLKGGPEEGEDTLYTLPVILGLGVATSIDALAAGGSIPAMGVSLVTATVIVATVTTVLSLLGGLAGDTLRAHTGPWLERAGGLVLIGLGLKLLLA